MVSEERHSVFISYAFQDSDDARRLSRLISNAGLDVWIGESEIIPGTDWRLAINEALSKADSMLLLVGPSSSIERGQNAEMLTALTRAAQDHRFRIIPVLLPGAEISNLPPAFRQYQTIDLRNTTQPSSEFNRLAAMLARDPKTGESVDDEQVGDRLRSFGDLSAAIPYYEKALHVAQISFGEANPQVATLLRKVGALQFDLGEIETALLYFNQALAVDEAAFGRNHPSVAADLNNIGAVYRSMGDTESALDYISQALLIREDVGDRAEMATTLSNIGEVYRSTGDFERALEYLDRALPMQEEFGDRLGMATTLNNIGGVYHSTGSSDRALEYYNRALPIREEVGDRLGIATTLHNIGMVHHRVGEPERALEYLSRALPISEEVGDRVGESVTRYNMAMIYKGSGRLKEAVEELRQVVRLDELLNQPGLESDRAMLAQLEQELGAQSG